MAVADAWAFGGMMTDLATIYGRSSTGRATAVQRADLPCRVAQASFRDQAGGDRTELASVRSLLWIEDYEMPADAVVQLNGGAQRWNVRPETIRYVRTPDGALGHWECDVVGSNRQPAPVTR